MEVWVSKSYDINLVISEIKKWNKPPYLYHNVVQDWINSRFPCCWDVQIPLIININDNKIEIIRDNTCSICLESGGSKLLPCGHRFHKTCIIKWMKVSKTCPLCRCSFI